MLRTQRILNSVEMNTESDFKEVPISTTIFYFINIKVHFASLFTYTLK